MIGEAALVGLLVALQAAAVPEGSWGGPHARLTVHKNGATIELDCARGALDERLRLDRAGHFDVPGRYVPQHGGPVRKNEIATGQPVRYRGHLSDSTLTFEIVADAGTVINSYTVQHGQIVHLMKCR